MARFDGLCGNGRHRRRNPYLPNQEADYLALPDRVFQGPGIELTPDSLEGGPITRWSWQDWPRHLKHVLLWSATVATLLTLCAAHRRI